MTVRLAILFLLLVSIGHGSRAEDEMRDFYAEPGLNPFRSGSGQDATENIDPFSGNLQLSYVDLMVPGNGGLDIAITRYYNLPQSSPGYANPFGYGWTMHFGRITIGSGHASQLCGSGIAPGADTRDNPSIEKPDGGRELLVHSAELDDGTYITRTNWKAGCIDPADYTRGLVATAPDGTAYFMEAYVFMQGEDGPAGEPAPTVETWLTSRIVDPFGNTIDIAYLTIANGMKLVSRIDASDGRSVLFDYVDTEGFPVTGSSMNARLSAIEANGQVWQYRYAPVTGVAQRWGSVHHYKLTSVIRPDGTHWDYTYGEDIADPGFNRLTSVTYPSGGKVHYSYQWVKPYLPEPEFSIVAIRDKTQENAGHAAGTWSWEFLPGHTDFAELGIQPLPDNAGRRADLTRITSPEGVERVYHVGYWALAGTHDILWEMGLKLRHEHLAVDSGDSTLKLVRAVSNSWDARVLSDEVYRGGILDDLWDSRTYAPLLTRRSTWLDGYVYTTDYGEHDPFGNPGITTEYAIFPTENGNRVTLTSYQNDTQGWFIGLPAVETVSQDGVVAGSVARRYAATGRLLQEDRFGVLTSYTYTDEGDVESVIDALGRVTLYGDYFRGRARQEVYPDGTQRSRTVNGSGTVASETNARGFTTSFAYDGLNRLSGIVFPKGSAVSVSYSASGKVLTRGSYREAVYWDGFGRETETLREDTGDGITYRKRYRYDETGRRVFESDWGVPEGIGWEFDVIGRPTRIVNQDTSERAINHQGAHREIHRDENGNITDYLFQVYGEPGNRLPLWTLSPEGVGTHTRRDAYGNITYLFQGEQDPENPGQYLGYAQHYGYNNRLQLTAIDSPADIGLTSYGRDVLGNMTSRQVADSAVVYFSYDELNRLQLADYPGSGADIAYVYDPDGNITSVANGRAVRRYGYDANGNRESEALSVDGTEYRIDYALDELDFVAGATYPSGRSVDYRPDAFGRPTRALPYITAATYHPDGSLERLEYANGRTMQYTRTPRGWLDMFDLGGLASLDYDYDPAGNVTAIHDLSNPANTRRMTYDGINRLTGATGVWGSASYEYDVFSNIIRKSDPARDNRSMYLRYLGLSLDGVSYEGSPAQRVFSYDAYGNITYSDDVIFDPLTGFPSEIRTTRQQQFDDAGNLIFSQRSARDVYGNILPMATGSFSSEYDGRGFRVRKIDHTDRNRWTGFFYSDAGQLLGEYDASGALYGHEHFYLGALQVASAKLNAPPLVDAGEDRQVPGGTVATLSASYDDLDGEVVSVGWMQLSGPEVEIADPTAAETFFTAPATDSAQTLVLRFTATDDRGAETASDIAISVRANSPPVADAGPDIAVLAGSLVTLDGSGSADAEGPLTFLWSGSDLSNPAAAIASIAVPDTGHDYVRYYTLQVTDTDGVSDTDQVKVSVFTRRSDTDGDGLPDGWEILQFGSADAFSGDDDPDGDGLTNRREMAEGTDPVSPDAPNGVVSIRVIQGENENLVAWQRPPAVAEFHIYWTNDPGLPLEAWEKSTVNGRYFAHDGIAPGVAYHYAVVAANATGAASSSRVMTGIAGARGWRDAAVQAIDLGAFDPSSVTGQTNRFGEAVIVAERTDSGIYRLFVWARSVDGLWGSGQQVSEDEHPHRFARAAIDDDGNILVAWAGGLEGSRSLHAAYRPVSGLFRPRDTVAESTPDQLADGDVTSLSHLEFTGNGSAFICWRQNILQTFGDHAHTGGSSALARRFDPIAGWDSEHNLELGNNTGDTLNLACDVSAGGRLVAAWERYDTFDPQALPTDVRDHDVWVATYEPGRGWTASETVEYLTHGIREASGSGIHNRAPDAAVHDGGRALVVWYNETDDRVESIEYDHGAAMWLGQETLESRGNQVSGPESHRVAASDIGHFIASWDDDFVVRTASESRWSRPRALPAHPAVLGIDHAGLPFALHSVDSLVSASRYVGGAWLTQTLGDLAASGGSRVINMDALQNDILYGFWLSGSSLGFATDEPGQDLPPPGEIDTIAPVTGYSADLQRVKGAKLYTIVLGPDEPATTRYRFSGEGAVVDDSGPVGEWQVYHGPFDIQLEKSGSGLLEFYSEDLAGNVEQTQTEVLQ